MTKLLLVLSLFFCLNAGAADIATPDSYAGGKNTNVQNHEPEYYTFFDWARGQNGWGYCYEFDSYGYVLNNGRPMHPMNCERVNPSYFDWARANNGYVYCFNFTPYGAVLNDGRPVHPSYCQYQK